MCGRGGGNCLYTIEGGRREQLNVTRTCEYAGLRVLVEITRFAMRELVIYRRENRERTYPTQYRLSRGELRELGGARTMERVARLVKRDREHSDWPIVVQRSDNAGNWPSLDKTAK